MAESVLDAIRRGKFNFEPEETKRDSYNRTTAMPGSDEKLNVLADRIRHGLPLWHPEDRISYDEGQSP